jgi:hypothetical protein
MTKSKKQRKTNPRKNRKEVYKTLKALVVTPNEKTAEFGSLLAVARAEARRREKCERNPPVRALKFFPELGVYVAVYEAAENMKQTG